MSSPDDVAVGPSSGPLPPPVSPEQPTAATVAPQDILATSSAGPAAVRGGTVRAAGYLLNAVLGAVSAAFLLRHLGVTDTGLYVIAINLAALIGGLSDLGLTALGVRELSVRGQADRQLLMGNLLGLRIVLTAAGMATMLVFSVAAGYRPVLIAGVAVSGVALLLQSLQSTLALSLMSRLRLGWVTAGEVGRQALLSALTVALVLSGAHLLAFLAVQIPAALAALFFTMVLVRGDVSFLPRFHWPEWRELLRDIVPYSISVALGVIYFRVSVIAVSLVGSAKQLGYFSVSFRILDVLIVVPGLIVTAALPIFARSAHDDHERLAYALSRVYQVSLIVGLWFVLGLALGAQTAISVVGGPKFGPAVGVLQIQAFGLGGSFVAAVWSGVLLSLGRLRTVMFINLGALIVGSALAAVLTQVDGAQGAALGTALTEISLAVVGAVAVGRARPGLMPSMSAVPRILVAAAVAAAAALASDTPPVVAVLLASGVYFGLLLLLRAVPDEVLLEVRRATARSGA